MTQETPANPRIRLLSVAAEKELDNPFPLYALAIEYKNSGDLENAQRYFEDTLHRFPGYVPTFFHFGGLLEMQGDYDRAKEIYRTGIALAQRSGELHALSELRGALAQAEAISPS